TPGEAWGHIVSAGIAIGERELTVGKLLLAAVAVYLALVGSWVVRSLLDRTVFEHREFERGVRDSFFTLLHYTLMVLGVFVALSLLGVDLSTFALIAGALGVGIGFGLQNVVNNFVSGLILLFERPVRIGDVVDVGGQRGTITKIGLRSTVLTTFDGAEQIVPNGDLIAEKVVNWTLTTPRARLALPVSVAYGNDPERVIGVLLEIGMTYELALDDPAPMAIFTGFGESSVDFELRVWLRAFEEILQARNELAARVVRRFAEEGIEIPFPQRDLHLRSGVARVSSGEEP
ncbi:MAG: mechanosensitive ion channel, partial [Acidobacteriota bacterium]